MFSKHKINADDPELLSSVSACFIILADISKEYNAYYEGKQYAEERSQMMGWGLVHGFAQLAISGNFRKETMKTLTILDIFPFLDSE